MPTPHIESLKGEIAPIVLTAGDPKRCEYIAKKYLTNYRLVNSVRGMTAYTGEYKGKEITVFPVGMGMPSMGIYAYELFKFYDVETMIRIGTSGSMKEDYKVLDTVLLDGSFTESNFALSINRDPNTHIAYADPSLNKQIETIAREQNLSYKKGIGLCNEMFDVYLNEEQYQSMIESLPQNINIVTVEMEAFALFYIANMLKKKAACLVSIVDSKYQKDVIVNSTDREQKLDNMIVLALETSLKL